MKIRLSFISILFACSLSWAAEKISDTAVIKDTKDYVDMIHKVEKLKMDDQIDAWQAFLSDHPKHTFRKEIEKNVELLQSLSPKKKDPKKGDERDTDLYLKAIEYSKKLSTQDQILMWQQFIDENPHNIYRNEAQTRLNKLKHTKTAPAPAPAQSLQPIEQKTQTSTPAQKNQVTAPVKFEPLAGTKAIKDPDQALFLASLAGIVVPGMGHWYTEDYVIAGVLTAIRLGGFAVGIPGIINSEYDKIYLGGGIAILSYAIDIADAGYSANRFNEDHSKKVSLPAIQNQGKTFPLFAYSFTF